MNLFLITILMIAAPLQVLADTIKGTCSITVDGTLEKQIIYLAEPNCEGNQSCPMAPISLTTKEKLSNSPRKIRIIYAYHEKTHSLTLSFNDCDNPYREPERSYPVCSTISESTTPLVLNEEAKFSIGGEMSNLAPILVSCLRSSD